MLKNNKKDNHSISSFKKIIPFDFFFLIIYSQFISDFLTNLKYYVLLDKYFFVNI